MFANQLTVCLMCLIPCITQFSRFDVEKKNSLKTRKGNHLLSDCAWEGVTVTVISGGIEVVQQSEDC